MSLKPAFFLALVVVLTSKAQSENEFEKMCKIVKVGDSLKKVEEVFGHPGVKSRVRHKYSESNNIYSFGNKEYYVNVYFTNEEREKCEVKYLILFYHQIKSQSIVYIRSENEINDELDRISKQ